MLGMEAVQGYQHPVQCVAILTLPGLMHMPGEQHLYRARYVVRDIAGCCDQGRAERQPDDLARLEQIGLCHAVLRVETTGHTVRPGPP